jgi:hypothetical protein
VIDHWFLNIKTCPAVQAVEVEVEVEIEVEPASLKERVE